MLNNIKILENNNLVPFIKLSEYIPSVKSDLHIFFFFFFLRGRFIDINKLLYRIVEEKKDKRKCTEINSENKRKDTWQS